MPNVYRNGQILVETEQIHTWRAIIYRRILRLLRQFSGSELTTPPAPAPAFRTLALRALRFTRV
jgi:hypothetical protein